MNVLILGGFLGSGKTTALMGLARYLVARAGSGRANTVMIIENEVGEVGIDDKLLRSGGFAVRGLFSGCACCTVAGELTVAASRIEREYDPEWLIVETTGIAYPRGIQDNLSHALGTWAKIAVMADAARWERLLVPMNNLLRGQIADSDAVIINKTDLADDAALAKIERDVLAFEPEARIFRVSAKDGISDAVWAAVTGQTGGTHGK
jgi:G3E family GTPase